MDIEENLFKKTIINYDKLLSYGFKIDNDLYIYKTKILDDSFEVIISIDKIGNVIGKIVDIDSNYEYDNFRLKDVTGEFVSRVKASYINVLKDIIDKCCITKLFMNDQSNRITKIINDKYKVKPEFMWEEYPNFGVFRNNRTNKWFGLIMNIERNKLDKKSSGNIDIINLKLDDLANDYLKVNGIYEAYHMNKKSWVSITLDDTLSDEYIINLVDKSYSSVDITSNWLIPANPKYFDIVNAFNDNDTIIWKQSNNILKDDIIYMYVGVPYSCIMYKCLVTKVYIPYEYIDKFITISKVMEIKLLKKYNNNEFTLDKLKEYGIKTVRGPRSIPDKLLKILDK